MATQVGCSVRGAAWQQLPVNQHLTGSAHGGSWRAAETLLLAPPSLPLPYSCAEACHSLLDPRVEHKDMVGWLSS